MFFTIKAKRTKDVPTHKVGLEEVLVLERNVTDEHDQLEKQMLTLSKFMIWYLLVFIFYLFKY